MIPSLLTAMCFAMAGISARQSAQCSGPERANTGRLLVGMLILGLLAWISWQGMPSRLLAGLAIAGGIGFGFGGFFMMLTLKRLGTPTSLLLVESTTAILAGLLAWLAIGDTMSMPQVIACMFIIAAVLFAGWQWMKESQPDVTRVRFAGYSFGFLSASCQALSLVISRQVFVVSAQASMPIDKLDAAFVRMVGGTTIAILVLAIHFLNDWRKNHAEERADLQPFHWVKPQAPYREQPLFWILVNGLFGPVLGVTCWLWAVSKINPGIVQSIASIAPLISLPIARLLEQEKLGYQFYIGAPLAILGVVFLVLS